MKELNNIQNLIFRLSAILFVVGLGLHLFMPTAGMIIYVVGILGFSAMQFLAGYDGDDLVIRRLRRQQLMSCVFFIISAACMFMQDMRFGPIELRRNIWTIFLTVGCVFQLYTAFRLPQEIEKQSKHPASKSGLKLILVLFASTTLFPSCSTQYAINGTTNIGDFEGLTLYLKSYKDEDMHVLDSCQVQHGRIIFDGALDSTQMVFLFNDEQSLIPLVLESGNISLTLDETTQNVTGTPLNDTLYSFIKRRLELDKQMIDLERMETKLIMDGVDEESRYKILIAESDRIIHETDRLTTSFIVRNSDNVLGPGVFMILTAGYPYPQMTPQINEILFRSKPFLKESTYVKAYLDAARQNAEKIDSLDF